MILHLNGSEEVNIKDKDNGFQDITINGLDYQKADGTIIKVNITLPNVKIDADTRGMIAYADKIDKSLWSLELNE